MDPSTAGTGEEDLSAQGPIPCVDVAPIASIIATHFYNRDNRYVVKKNRLSVNFLEKPSSTSIL